MLSLFHNRLLRHFTSQVWIISLLCLTAYSQQQLTDTKFQRLFSENSKLEKGLSQNWVYCILQDQMGYMWFGTWEGLNKYDGYRFIIYNVDDGLSDHTVNCILEDMDGYLWVGTDNGLNRFDRKSSRFIQFFNQPGDSASLVDNKVNDIVQSRDGRIWIATAAGLSMLEPGSHQFKSYFIAPQDYNSLRSNYFIDIYEDSGGILWISSTYGLIKFNPIRGRSTRYYNIPGDPNSLSSNNVRCVIQDRNSNFWIATTRGLDFFSREDQHLSHYRQDPLNPSSLSGNWVRVLYSDSRGRIWAGTNENGLNLFDPATNSFIRFHHHINDESSISNNKIYSIFEDRSSNIWVGTFNGVNKISSYSNDFNTIRRLSNDEYSMNNNIVWGFAEDNRNDLWICTSGGINIYDRSGGTYSSITAEGNNGNSLSGNDTRSILYISARNEFWVGTYGSGLNRVDAFTLSVSRYRQDPNANSISSDYINQIILDRAGQVWMATGNGVCRFDPADLRFRVYRHDPGDTLSLGHNIVISALEDQRGILWFGTNNGISCLNLSTEKFRRYLSGPDPSVNHIVFCLHQDRTGKIWAGTSGSGLFKLDSTGQVLRHYSTVDGMPNNIVYGILEDKEGNLWLSTNRGLSKFYVIGERFVNYDVTDGLQSNEFNLGAAFHGTGGELYFGGMNGYNVFYPERIIHNPNKPQVVITAFRKFNEIQPGEFLHQDTVVLSHDDNFFSFEISALDYTNPSRNRYRYMLENFDGEWTYTDAGNRIAEYKKVRPGTYVFRANGTNNDGVWANEDIRAFVIVKPPWFHSWAFRIPSGIILLVAGWWLVHNRIRRIRQKHEVERHMLEIEKQKFDLEQKALRLQMNPHFIFNSLNSIQSYIIEHDSQSAILYLWKFSQLMRLILTNSANKFVPLKDELKSLTYYMDLEQLRFEGKFDYEVIVAPDIDEEFVEIPPMIIQPYVENAIIHGIVHKSGKGHLKLQFTHEDGRLLCVVEDNGIGREKAAEIALQDGLKKKSRGMMITKARLDILKHQTDEAYEVKVLDLRDQSGAPAGTRVELVIQFHEG